LQLLEENKRVSATGGRKYFLRKNLRSVKGEKIKYYTLKLEISAQ
jgi:hypothetical protein